MSLTIDNTQFNRFVQFAEQQMRAGNTTAIARGGEAAAQDPLAGRNIVAATGDKTAPIFGRSDENKLANNDARRLFRDSIISIFGGEANIPQSVKNAMKLADYDQGKPLTARRIIAVKTAIEVVAQPHVEFNDSVRSSVQSGNLGNLPENIKSALAGLADEMRGIFGEDVVPQGAGLEKIVHLPKLSDDIAALCSTASSRLRNVSADEVAKMFRSNAIVNLAIDSALAGAGVTDAKVVKDVKNALCPRAEAALANANGPEAVDAVIATAKAEASVLGKALDAVAKARASTLADAADAIAAETGMGKAYVMNNLAVSDIASDSGKLRFLYSGVVSKAKDGTMPDPEAVADKAKKIVGDFARAKIDIVKSIEAAGFDAVERAAHIANALKDPAWLDPDVPAVSKRLAGDATMKNAARLLAGALQKNAAASLDDMQLRDVFIAFGKAFTQVFLSNDFRAYADKWTGQGETLARLQRMLLQFIGKDFPELVPALASLGAEGRLANVVTHLSNRLNEIHSLKMDYMTLDQAGLKGPPAGEAIRGVMNNPNLVYDEAAFKRCDEDDAACNLTSVFLSMMVGAVPRAGADANAVERCAARQAKGREIAAKYAEGLAQETLPLLKKVVDALDWREASAAASEETVKNFVNDMKTWRDIAPGSQDSAGLESVMVRRMDGYLKDVLAGNTGSATFNTNQHPGLFETFLMDLTRVSYTINGKKLEGAKLEERLPDFMDAIKDPAKRKIVSVMVNQQIFGDFSSSIANLIPLDGWKNGMEPEDVAGIPGIGKFATRDISKSGCPLYGTSPMAFEIDVSDDESTVKVRATSAFPLNFDHMNPKAQAGTCTISQEFTIDLSGPEPAIRDLKIGQALS